MNPDVVLMDLRMPEIDGLTAIKHLRVDYPQVAIIILTTYNEDQLMFQGLQLGAKSYLLKDVDDEMWKAIKKIAIDKDTTIKGLIIDAFKRYIEGETK